MYYRNVIRGYNYSRTFGKVCCRTAKLAAVCDLKVWQNQNWKTLKFSSFLSRNILSQKRNRAINVGLPSNLRWIDWPKH